MLFVFLVHRVYHDGVKHQGGTLSHKRYQGMGTTQLEHVQPEHRMLKTSWVPPSGSAVKSPSCQSIDLTHRFIMTSMQKKDFAHKPRWALLQPGCHVENVGTPLVYLAAG